MNEENETPEAAEDDDEGSIHTFADGDEQQFDGDGGFAAEDDQ